MRRISRLWIVIGLLAGMIPLMPVGMAAAANATVTICDEIGFDAALDAVQTTGGGTLNFDCGPNPVTIPLTSEKVISEDTRIDGGGLVTLDGQGQTRIFYVDAGVTFEIEGLTLTNGNGQGSLSAGYGGAIYNLNSTLSITDSVVSGNNTGVYGGAIFSFSGTLTVTNSTLSNNSAIRGGGILNDNSALTITNSTLSGNRATSSVGGAIYSDGSNGGTLDLTSSILSGNSAVDSSGGAIYNNFGAFTITTSMLHGNDALVDGGAIYNFRGALTATASAVSDNRARDGGGIYNFHGAQTFTDSVVSDNMAVRNGGGILTWGNIAVVNITSSTLSGNHAGSNGGGIYNTQGVTFEIAASTLSGNDAVDDGGGIYNDSGTLAVTNSTLSGNGADVGSALYTSIGTINLFNSTLSDNSTGEFGGALFNNDGTINLAATIVAANGEPSGPGDNCGGSGIISQGENLSDDDSCDLTLASDLENTDPLLGPLADNGGSTLTHVPQPGSPAIDAALSCPTGSDQRGFARPQGAACDIGSVEVRQGATYTICASYYTGALTSPRYGGCGAGTLELNVPGNLSFCVNSWTGQLTYPFGRPCPPPRWTHTLPDDGDLLTCVSRYTGMNRWVTNHGQCNASEIPNLIPALP